MIVRALRRSPVIEVLLVVCVAWLVTTASSVAAAPAVPGVSVTEVDLSAFPEVVVEFTATAGVVGDGLVAGDVALDENGVRVPVRLEQVAATGMEVVLLIDASGSMKEGGALAAAQDAATRFVQMMPPEVAIGVVSFADQPRLVSPLTQDRVTTTTAIARLQAGGETALYDAVVLAAAVFSGSAPDEQIVLLSDGGNTVGTATLADATAVSAEHRTSVVQLTSSEADPAGLEQLASAGQGSVRAVTDPSGLMAMYESVAEQLVHRYRLRFTSTATGDVVYTLTVAGAAVSVDAALPVPPSTQPTTVAPTASATTSPATPTTSPAATTVVVDSSGTGWRSDVGTTTWLVIGAAALFLALLLLGMVFVPSRRADTVRLGQAGVGRGGPSAVAGAGSGVGDRLSALADRALERGRRRRSMAIQLEVADIALRPGEFAVLMAVGALVAALVLSLPFGPWGALLGVVVVPAAAGAVVRRRADRRRRAFDDQLPDVLHLLVSLLRAGYGLPQALDAVSHQAAEPAASEFRRMLFEVRIGRDPTDALAVTAERMRSRDFRWVVTAITINREVGGELAVILDSVGETVRERQRLARQVRSLTAEGRLSALLLTALPPLLVVLLALVSPGYFAPMATGPGPFLVGLGVVMLACGWIWMRRLIRTPM